MLSSHRLITQFWLKKDDRLREAPPATILHFLNIVKKPLTRPPRFEHLGCKFIDGLFKKCVRCEKKSTK